MNPNDATPNVAWCCACGAAVEAGRCTNRACALSVKVGAPGAYALRVRELDRLAKSALLDIVAGHARDAGARWLIGGPALWSKDELVNGILAFEFPPVACLTCGMVGADPELHHRRYGHRPKFADESGRVFVWFAGRWAEALDETAAPGGAR